LASSTGLQAFTDALKLIRALPDAGLAWIVEIDLADVAALDAVITRPRRTRRGTNRRRVLRPSRPRSRVVNPPSLPPGRWNVANASARPFAKRSARLDARGVAINFSIVADEAGVDQSWLYSQPDVALEHTRAAGGGPNLPTTCVHCADRQVLPSSRQSIVTDRGL